jgi:hypothetical protein
MLRLLAALTALSCCAPAIAADIDSTPAPPRVECAIILRGPTEAGWLHVETADSTAYLNLGPSPAIVWHLDERVTLPASELRPGVRIRYVGQTSIAERITVVTLGPLAMEAAVEEWVADVSGGWRGLSEGEVATIAALGSPSILVREAVTAALRERGARALRVLIHAQRLSGDAEVRLRAEGLLGALGWRRGPLVAPVREAEF